MSTADDIREKPALVGAGDAELLLGMTEENPDGAGLSPFERACIWGAGSVMNPVSVLGWALPFPSFLFFAFSVLPFVRGCASRKSAAWGIALHIEISHATTYDVKDNENVPSVSYR